MYIEVSVIVLSDSKFHNFKIFRACHKKSEIGRNMVDAFYTMDQKTEEIK